ncbi:MAG: hypothetical protein V3T05_04020, partial [Myxococcota bacterium]
SAPEFDLDFEAVPSEYVAGPTAHAAFVDVVDVVDGGPSLASARAPEIGLDLPTSPGSAQDLSSDPLTAPQLEPLNTSVGKDLELAPELVPVIELEQPSGQMPEPGPTPSSDLSPRSEVLPGPDLASAPELSAGPDLASASVLSAGPDPASAPELSASPDPASAPELPPSPDLPPGPELSSDPELSSGPELSSARELQSAAPKKESIKEAVPVVAAKAGQAVPDPASTQRVTLGRVAVASKPVSAGSQEIRQQKPSKPGRLASTPIGAVVVSSQDTGAWKLYGAVGGTAAFAALVVVLWSAPWSGEPDPPEWPNPLRERVEAWRAAGAKPTVKTVEEGIRRARAGLASGTGKGLRDAFGAARSALLLDHDAVGAIAAYTSVMAQSPERLEPEQLTDSLGAIRSAIGSDRDSIYRADLEEARAWLFLRGQRPRIEAARLAAKDAAIARPESSSVKLVRAVTMIRTRPGEAAAELEALTEVDDVPVRLPLWLGEAQLRAGQVERALTTWERSLVGGPEDIGVARRMARLSAAAGDFADSTARLEAIALAGWASAEDRLVLARLMARTRRKYDQAIELLDDGLKDANLSPVNRARLIAEKASVVALARANFRRKEEVSGWLDLGLELAPDLPELLYIAGILDQREGLIDNALESLEAANELAPDRPEVAFRLALILRDDDQKAALQVLAAAAREAAQYVPLHLLRMTIELDAGRSSSAMTAFRRALDYDPERYRSGRELDPFVDPPAAHRQLAKALAKHARRSDNSMITTAVAMAYYFAGDIGRASSMLNGAIRADPNLVGSRLYRAVIAFHKGKKNAAKRDLAAALQADSQHSVVRLYQARLSEQLKKTGDAERIYRDLVESNPLDSSPRIGLARVMLARRARQDAIDLAVKVLTIKPEDREALRFLVKTNRRLKSRRGR